MWVIWLKQKKLKKTADAVQAKLFAAKLQNKQTRQKKKTQTIRIRIAEV